VAQTSTRSPVSSSVHQNCQTISGQEYQGCLHTELAVSQYSTPIAQEMLQNARYPQRDQETYREAGEGGSSQAISTITPLQVNKGQIQTNDPITTYQLS
jgi:hypothetical protein